MCSGPAVFFAGAIRPDPCAKLLEDRKCLRQEITRFGARLCASSRDTVCEEGPCELVGLWDLPLYFKRSLERIPGAGSFVRSRRNDPAAPRRCPESPATIECFSMQ